MFYSNYFACCTLKNDSFRIHKNKLQTIGWNVYDVRPNRKRKYHPVHPVVTYFLLMGNVNRVPEINICFVCSTHINQKIIILYNGLTCIVYFPGPLMTVLLQFIYL